ncbi:MAG: hypothetical protein IJ740_06115, partial [Ruminococcus sp.]|nr:hypothetical protein [Ruminococcus sp.]
MEILREKFLGFNGGRTLVRAELCVDSAAELPGKNDISGRTLAAGSLAWDISAGKFFGLKADGTWVDQEEGETAPALSASTSLISGRLDLNDIGPEVSELDLVPDAESE